MEELAGRLAALDPDAGAAVQVIAYFDRLVEGRAGLEALVRGAAVLSGCPARLVDEARHVRVRVEPDGRRRDENGPVRPEWPSVPLIPGGAPAVWLERTGPRTVVDAMVLERTASAARHVLDRTRGRAPVHGPADDPALLETVLDPTAAEAARLHAARGLGLDPDGRARAIALRGGPQKQASLSLASGERALVQPDPGPEFTDESRRGVGPAVPVLELPRSWSAARTALRFTAEGTDQDPGPRIVHSDDLGTLALLAAVITPGTEPPPDVRALDQAAAASPWLLPTLYAVINSPSRRTAATELNVHHSTLQDRLAHAESLLGWPVRTPEGHLRLQLALAARLLTRNQL
ncbi:helix-turn-helix domain-containing protein [Streptomyces sp. NBC_00286]|uniref:helix-turn-helix domain-containing protein n=1 Tax=Streptomyces sp. NBC_00286 TaxID=2975701 RepID=UPI002E2CE6F7|nr:helix-turn-helix domain-containing protein [Streptomyces sp. NBC_00286]